MLKWEDGILTISEFLSRVSKNRERYQTVVTNKNRVYYNIPSAFDIETSSFYYMGQKCAIMYCWQFGIDNLVTLGRTWEEFFDMLDILKLILGLNDNVYLVVYVHNLPYEFQFIRKHIEWVNVFLLDRLKPVYARTSGFEFRCSLKLSGGKKLSDVAEDLSQYNISKKIGDLDYSKLRTPLTPLTKKEIRYCEYDIRILQCYIYEKIIQDGDITKIPLTNTGYVRNYVRKSCFRRWKRYHNFISSLTLDTEEYNQLRRAFQGGFTHANARYVRKTLDQISSADIGSSYPFVLVSEKFPMSKAKMIEGEISKEKFNYLLRNKCCLFDIEFTNLEPVLFHEHPLSISQCRKYKKEEVLVDNGRVVIANKITTTITEQDFFVYRRFYKWESAKVYNLRYYEKEYLPKDFILAVLKLYLDKTLLKGDTEKIVDYMIAKNMINACYGMVVTNIIRDILEYTDNEFKDPVPADTEEALKKYNENIRRFLFYPWGVWVTAYARANLFSAIAELGNDYVYSDTDSTKYKNKQLHVKYFENYNKQVLKKIELVSEYYHIPIDQFSPKTLKGEIKTIGLWEQEGTYKQFKTLGAKRYLYSKDFVSKVYTEEDGTQFQLNGTEFYVTIAGANKKKTTCYLLTTENPFENFDADLIVPPEYSGRLTLTYIHEMREGEIVDYLGNPYHFKELSAIHMESSEYSLSIFKEYMDYLEGLQEFSE